MSEEESRTGLGLSRQALAKSGAFGALIHSVKLFGRDHPSLLRVQLAFVLPFAVVSFAVQYAIQAIANSVVNVPVASSSSVLSLHGSLSIRLAYVLLVIILALSLMVTALVASAVYFTVGRLRDGHEDPSLADVAHALPRLWKRLIITAITNLVLLAGIWVAYTVLFVIFLAIVSSQLFPLVLGILGVLSIVPVLIVSLIYAVAIGVTCFEEDDGFAAFRRGKRLLHDKWGSAFILLVVLSLCQGLLSVILQSPAKPSVEFSWTWLALSILYVLLYSYLTEVTLISWAWFYFSCVAYSEQNAPAEGDEALEAGYQSIPPSS